MEKSRRSECPEPEPRENQRAETTESRGKRRSQTASNEPFAGTGSLVLYAWTQIFALFHALSLPLYYGIGAREVTIGELAEQAGVNIQTIRFYERKGLLPPPHRWPDTGHRDYDDDALQQMRFIQTAKAAGFTLRDIRELLDMRVLPGESCEEVEAMVRAKIDDLDQRLTEIRDMRRRLERMAKACQSRKSKNECPALWQITQSSTSTENSVADSETSGQIGI